MSFCQVLLGYLEETKILSGIISDDDLISGSIKDPDAINGELEYPECNDIPDYSGNYEIIPKTTAQILETQGTQMKKDISVLSIPIYITENQSKGNTVYIG